MRNQHVWRLDIVFTVIQSYIRLGLGVDICIFSLCVWSGVLLTLPIVLIISGRKLDISFIYESLRVMAVYSLQVLYYFQCSVYCNVVILYRNVSSSVFSLHIQTKSWPSLPVSASDSH